MMNDGSFLLVIVSAVAALMGYVAFKGRSRAKRRDQILAERIKTDAIIKQLNIELNKGKLKASEARSRYEELKKEFENITSDSTNNSSTH